MIYQAAIDLQIDKRKVQAIIDFDTGLIGFTENIGSETVEYFFTESPTEFKMAFLDKMKPHFAEETFFNHKISRKNKDNSLS
ncbi:MAG: hypothetical protein AB8F95_04540 [Bacteroidia bacterium]